MNKGQISQKTYKIRSWHFSILNEKANVKYFDAVFKGVKRHRISLNYLR